LVNTIRNVARDIGQNWKPGEDLGAKLPAGIGLAVWGAGVPADKMQEIAGLTSQLASLGKTPDELAAALQKLL